MERTINFAAEFSEFPGGRYRKDGKFSGEEFRDDVLMPLLRSQGKTVLVNFNGVIGLPHSFLDEAFGILVEKLGYESVAPRLQFVADDDPLAIRDIQSLMIAHAREGR